MITLPRDLPLSPDHFDGAANITHDSESEDSASLATILNQIDQTLVQIDSTVGTLQTDVGTLQTDVGTLQTDVGTLQAQVSQLYVLDPIVRTSDFTAVAGTLHRVVPPITVSLPNPTESPGHQIILKNQSNIEDDVTLIPLAPGTWTIELLASQTYAGPGVSVTLVSDGISDWMVI